MNFQFTTQEVDVLNGRARAISERQLGTLCKAPTSAEVQIALSDANGTVVDIDEYLRAYDIHVSNGGDKLTNITMLRATLNRLATRTLGSLENELNGAIARD